MKMMRLFLLAFFFLQTSAFAVEEPSCFPVELEDHVIMCFKKGVGSITAQNRSLIVGQKIKRVAEDYSFSMDQISTMEVDGSYLISAGDLPLISLSSKDLEDPKSDLSEAAKSISLKIRASILSYRESHSSEALMRGLLYTLLATSVLFLGLYLVVVIARYLRRVLFEMSDKHSDRFKFKSFNIISPYRLKQLISGFIWVAKASALFFLFYFYIPLELSFFPWTAKYSSQIISLVSNPLLEVVQVILNYIPNLFYILVIVFLTHFLLKFIKLFFDEIETGHIHFVNFHKEWAQPTYKLIQIIFYALALVMMFPYLPGSSSPAFQGLSVFFGVLISFGSGSAIANMVSGIVITYMRPFKLGDRVKIADTVGDIIEKNFLVTRIKTIKNVDVTIPNSMVLGSHIVNYSSSALEQGLILNTTVTIGYDAPWKTVHELLKQAALNTELIDKDKEPFVFQTALNDFYVSYEINAYTRHASRMAKIYSDLHQNIQDAFNQAGVEIMSPHYGSLRDGNETTIPASYRSSQYEAPPFRLSQTHKDK